MSAAEINPAPSREAWLFGRGMDLMLGCGLGYILSIPILLLVSEATGATEWPALLIIVMGLLTNTPHYGATIVRVYDAREDRRKYVVFAVYIPIALALLLVAATRNIWLSSILITLYFTWSPWHFAGQNYGLALVFLRKRGIEVDSTTKRLVYTSFVLSAALAIIAIHSGQEDLVFAPDTLRVVNTPSIISFRLPTEIARVVVPVAFLAYLGCPAAAVWRLRRRARLRDLAPALVLVLTQALWFIFPLILLQDAAGGWDLILASVWISTAHSAQYLWVTAYYARSSERGTSAKKFLSKSFFAGTAVLFLPAILLAPDFLGDLPFDAGLAATIFAAVNIHHFILDGAIWKLRDGRVARILLRTPDTSALPESIEAQTRKPWLRRLVWSIAGACVAAQLMNFYAMGLIANAKHGYQIVSAARINRWIGRETVSIQFEIGRRLAAEGDRTGAIEHYRRSIELFPTARAWAALGDQYQAEGEWDLALSAFDAALELNPDFSGSHHRRAVALLATASPETIEEARNQATRSLERALKLFPGHAAASLLLARIQLESGSREDAVHTLEKALDEVDPARAESIRRELAALEQSGEKTPR